MITRENYEEYFLLYVDDELPATLRSAVETFVAENPDLQEEWETLRQCRIRPDQEQGFNGKDSLFHYDTSFLSYVDGELGEEERGRLEEWVRLHPEKSVELQQLMMTVSQPDLTIVFPDKESLYRGRSRGVVYLRWLSAGIAAALLGAVVLLLFPRQRLRGTIATRHDIHHGQSAPSGPKNVSPLVTNHGSGTLYSATTGAGKPIVARKKERQQKPFNAANPEPERTSQLKATLTSLPIDPIGRRGNMGVAAADPKPTGEVVLAVAPAVIITREQSSFATQELLHQEQEKSPDSSISYASAAPSKYKLRGIFRKVGRAFSLTADRDNEGQKQVLISAFQVAVK